MCLGYLFYVAFADDNDDDDDDDDDDDVFFGTNLFNIRQRNKILTDNDNAFGIS